MNSTAERHGAGYAWFVVAMLMAATSYSNGGQMKSVPKRIKFEHGRTTAIMKGTVSKSTPLVYLLKAGADQTMSVHLTSSLKSITFSVVAADGETLVSTTDDWSGPLPARGDNRIRITSGSSASVAFTLEVTVR